MKSYPKISVITPSYNQGEFIERTILSIISQDYPNLEYIVCDGGSTDQTIEILNKYDKRISWWCSEKDNGQTDAINKGLRKATGDIVGWINSDDVLLPGALKQVAEFYQKNPDTDFANGYLVEIDKNDTMINFVSTIMSRFFAKHGCYNVLQLGMFWKRDLHEKLGYLDASFHATMDLEWLIRVYEADCNVRRLSRYIGAIRIYENTKTALGGRIWERDYDEIRKRYNNHYVFNSKSRYYLFFQLTKFISGCFFRNRLMRMKYMGKKVLLFDGNR